MADSAMAEQDFSDLNYRVRDSLGCWNPESLGFNLIEKLLCHICKNEREGAVLVFLTGWEDITAVLEKLGSNPILGNPNKVLLLGCHGSMATAEQKLIFNPAPPGVRKVVLATNMAETSITINDVVFVIDCGKAKETSYDALNNTPCLLPQWVSKASARQRRGRAGRVQPGVCYHLYPKVVHDAFDDYQQPELLRTPLQSLCLQIKSLGLGSIEEFLSKALQPPEYRAVHNAVELLKTIGALDSKEELTDLGHHLSNLPVEPRLGKMLLMAAIFRCLDPVLTIAAGLTTRDPFVMPMEKKEEANFARFKFGKQDCSDHLGLVNAYEGWRRAMNEGTAADYCWTKFLSFQTLQRMHSLRKQFQSLLSDAGFDMDFCNDNSRDQDLVRGVICAGLYPGVASAVVRSKSTTFKTKEDGQVNVHQNSVNALREQNLMYPWLVFNEKVKTSNCKSQTGYIFLHGGTAISWRSQKQSLTTTSSYYAEVIAIHEAAKEAVWLKRLTTTVMASCGLPVQSAPVDLFEDNAAVVRHLTHDGYIKSDRTKHIDPKFYHAKELHGSEICIKKIAGVDNPADMLTKTLNPHLLRKHCAAVGMRKLSSLRV